jgi:hypothetical protein
MKVREAIRLIEEDGWFLVATRPEGTTLMRYAVVTERANGNYSTYVPDLRGDGRHDCGGRGRDSRSDLLPY